MPIENKIQRRLIRTDQGGWILMESSDGRHWTDVPQGAIADIMSSRIPPTDVSTFMALPPGRFKLNQVDETIELEIAKRVEEQLAERVAMTLKAEADVRAKIEAQAKAKVEAEMKSRPVDTSRYEDHPVEDARVQRVGNSDVGSGHRAIELD